MLVRVCPTLISIHALREEGDGTLSSRSRFRTNFNPRPPRGGRLVFCDAPDIYAGFQSTPSARRATLRSWAFWFSYHDFNPRPPRGGRPTISPIISTSPGISIHALREEGDGTARGTDRAVRIFQSTPSARRATWEWRYCRQSLPYFNPRPPRGGRLSYRSIKAALGIISIHALREEGDRPRPWHVPAPSDFNPRPPRGGRPSKSPDAATIEDISIHALREEGDAFSARAPRTLCYFNPRPPRGGRQPGCYGPPQGAAISIHALREEGDGALGIFVARALNISIHALREEGDSQTHVLQSSL